MSATDVAPRNKGGRPRKNTVVTKQEFIDDVDDDTGEREGSFSGLFDEATVNSIVKVRVIRKEPNEGTVGYLEDPTMGEAEITERWGGSSYLIQGIDHKGNIKKASTIKIAGDPIFVSKVAEMSWRRGRGLPAVAPAESGAAAAAPAMSLQEILMLMQTQDERRRSEEREHSERLRKIEIEAQAAQRKEAAEYADRVRREQLEADSRARRDEEERDRRRAKDDEERETRRRRDQQEAEQRQQAFMQQTIQMLQQSSNQALQFVKATAAEHKPDSNNTLMEAVKTLVAIKDVFGGEGSDVEESPMNLLIKHGAEWVNGLSNGIAGAIREVKGGGTSGQANRPQLTSVPAAPSVLAMASPMLNDKVETLVAKLAAKGLDPIAAMTSIVDNVLRDVDRLPQRGSAPAPVAEPKPFVQGPVGVANNDPVPVVVETQPKVYRLSVKRG